MKRIFLFAAAITIFFGSCRFIEKKQIKGDGNIVKAARSVSAFTGVETRGSIDIVVSPGDYKVVVESDQNILPDIVTEVVNNTLVVHFKEGNYNYSSATVYVTAPAINVFKSAGSGNISNKGKFSGGEKTQITIGGSGNVELDINSPAIDAEIWGSGNISIAGETKDFSSKVSGSGNIYGYDLKTETVKASVFGSGNTDLSVSVKLDVEIAGSGNVSYKGSPQVSSSIHGSGTVSPAN